MQNRQPHLLQLSHTHTGGAEEWMCPTCERRILIDWNDSYRSTILTPGDSQVSHVGGCAQRSVQTATDGTDTAPDIVLTIQEELGPLPITEAMHPWLRWMHAAGLANGDHLH